MTDIALYISEYLNSADISTKINEVIKFLKLNGYSLKKLDTEDFDFVESIVSSLVSHLNNQLSSKILFNEQNVIFSLKRIHNRNWQRFVKQINKIVDKLNEKSTLSEQDIVILDSIAEAMEQECTNLYNRIGGRV